MTRKSVGSIPIPKARHAFLLSAMHAAEDGAVMLDTMPDDAAGMLSAVRNAGLGMSNGGACLA